MHDPLIDALCRELDMPHDEGYDMVVRRFLRAMASPEVLPLLVNEMRRSIAVESRGIVTPSVGLVTNAIRAALGVPR